MRTRMEVQPKLYYAVVAGRYQDVISMLHICSIDVNKLYKVWYTTYGIQHMTDQHSSNVKLFFRKNYIMEKIFPMYQTLGFQITIYILYLIWYINFFNGDRVLHSIYETKRIVKEILFARKIGMWLLGSSKRCTSGSNSGIV